MRLKNLALFLIIFGFAALLFPDQASAYQGEGLGIQIYPGFDGYCREGDWFPVRIVLENTGPNFEGELHITGKRPGDLGSVYATTFSAPSGSRKSNTILVFAGGFFNELEAHVVVKGQTISTTPFRITCLTTEDFLFGVLAEQTSPFNVLIDLDPIAGSANIAQLSLEDFSDSPYAYEALDAVVISGIDTSSLTSAQLEGISGWIASGGQLLLTGGPTWNKSLPAFRALLPLNPIATTRKPSLEGLAAVFEKQNSLNSESIITTGNLNLGAEVLVKVDDTPIVVRRKYGNGSVSVLTVDPTLSPLKDWVEIAEVYRLVFTSLGDGATWTSGFISWNFAREAVSIIPGLDLPPFAWICGLLFIYIMVIGPVNYWLLRRWKRREFAWISIPLLVILFTILTYAVGRNTRGNLPILNRITIVQSWPDSGHTQADTLIGIFSPDRSTYELSVGDGFSPYAIPEDFQTGRDSFTFIQSSKKTTIPNIQVDIGGIEAFGLSGHINSPQVSSELIIDLYSPVPKLLGEITLPANLPLKDAVLLAPGAVQPLGDLPGGEEIFIDVPLNSTGASQSIGFNRAPYSPNMNTVEDIIGANYYASFNDPEISARIALLNAMMDPFDRRIERGFGVFLVGWSDSPIVPIDLVNSNFESLDMTAHIIALHAPIEYNSADPFSVPPSLFQWEVLDFNYSRPNGPYDVYLEPGGEMRMKYNLDDSIHYSEVTALTLHMEGDQNTSNIPSISLWDFSNESWEIIESASWGTSQISDPNRYVEDRGEIRVQIINSLGQAGIYLERLDFTLTVLP